MRKSSLRISILFFICIHFFSCQQSEKVAEGESTSDLKQKTGDGGPAEEVLKINNEARIEKEEAAQEKRQPLQEASDTDIRVRKQATRDQEIVDSIKKSKLEKRKQMEEIGG